VGSIISVGNRISREAAAEPGGAPNVDEHRDAPGGEATDKLRDIVVDSSDAGGKSLVTTTTFMTRCRRVHLLVALPDAFRARRLFGAHAIDAMCQRPALFTSVKSRRRSGTTHR
jgi:hypothetical protein